MCYTLIGTADIYGFIVSACHTVLRDQISDEGATGTVFRIFFVLDKYLPLSSLGKFEFGEARSVVYIDNASTHMANEVEAAIHRTDAILIYGPPYSLNPIKPYSTKAYLK